MNFGMPDQDEDQNYKQMLISQLNAPPPPVDSGVDNAQLVASLATSANQLGSVGGRTADSSGLQRYADLISKSQQARQNQLAQQNENRNKILSSLAMLKDKQTQHQGDLALASQEKEDARKFQKGMADQNFAQQKALLGMKNALAQNNAQDKQDAKPSVAESAVDRNFAKDYNDFIAQGGYAELEKGLNQVQEVANQLKSDDSLTGLGKGMIPDSVRAYTNPKAVDVKDRLEDVIQRSMRQIMGAQFTENEGKRLLARAFNPNLPTEMNAARVDKLLNSMKQMAQAKINAAKYYEQNGTLAGFQGLNANNLDEMMADVEKTPNPTPGMNDVYAAESKSMAPKAGPKAGDVVKGYQFKGGDPSDKANWVKVQ